MTTLHGFLGRPEDWDGVLGDEWIKPGWLARFEEEGATGAGGGSPPLTRASIDSRVTAARAIGLHPWHPTLDTIAAALNRETTGDVLLGYSMGGRIALHMLLQEPGRWRRAVIVSASPGHLSDAAREARIENDRIWAERFLRDDWDAVVADWNAQGVFAHDPPDRLPRKEGDFDRIALAAALVLGSVARQRDLRPELETLNVPILWLAGAQDAKYAALAEECAALNPRFTATVLPHVGHRAPWGDPAAFRAAVDDFITIRP